MNKENKIKYVEALGNLMGGIKENYKNWGGDIDKLDESSKKIKLKIKTTFKIIGAAAAAANLLLEFNIPAKKDDRLTNKRKGNVNLGQSILTYKTSLQNEIVGILR